MLANAVLDWAQAFGNQVDVRRPQPRAASRATAGACHDGARRSGLSPDNLHWMPIRQIASATGGGGGAPMPPTPGPGASAPAPADDEAVTCSLENPESCEACQ